MTDKLESIKFLQIRFPQSYAGIEFCLNVLPENSNLDENNKDTPQISNYTSGLLQEDVGNISNLSINDEQLNNHTFSSLSPVRNETSSSNNIVPEVNNSFQSPSNISHSYNSNIYPNLQAYKNQPFNPTYQQNLKSTNNPIISSDNSQRRYTNGKISQRKIYQQRRSQRKYKESDDFSDNPSDYESDHNLMKMRSGLYHDRDYYDKDRDYYYYKTKDGRRYKHYKY